MEIARLRNIVKGGVSLFDIFTGILSYSSWLISLKCLTMAVSILFSILRSSESSKQLIKYAFPLSLQLHEVYPILRNFSSGKKKEKKGKKKDFFCLR